MKMSSKRGIYLGAFKANHPGYDIVYQDINNKRDIGGDMLSIDLSQYDYIIATPPCNYYSRANYRRNCSKYSLATKDLLPCIIEKLCILNKPFIVENVRNDPLFKKNGLYNYPCYIYKIGRHTYWTNVKFGIADIEQRQDFHSKGYVIKYDDMNNLEHQGGFNVHNVIERWLNQVVNEMYYNLQLDIFDFI